MKKINEWDEKIIKIILDQGSNMVFTLGELLKQYFNDKEWVSPKTQLQTYFS